MTLNGTNTGLWAAITHPATTNSSSPTLLRLLLSTLSLKSITILAVGLILWTIINNVFFHPLHKIPGPYLAKFSQLWRNYRYFRGTWHDDVLDLHGKYGKIVRIAPNEVSFVDEHGLNELYGHGKQVVKSNWYDTWNRSDMSVSFFSTTDIKLHRHIRSRVSSAYSMTAILGMEPLIQDVMDLHFVKLGQMADEKVAISINKLVNYFTFDLVAKLAFGDLIGFIEQGRDIDGVIQSIHDGFYLMSNMGNVPFQMSWFNNSASKWVAKTLGGRRLNAFDRFAEWMEKKVEDRMEHGLALGQRRDLLQTFIEAKDPQGLPVTKNDVLIEGVNILGAGADTTTSGILACLGELLTNPNSKQKLIDEVDCAYEMGIGVESREVTFKEAEKLPYLAAVVKESLRLCPSIPYQLPRSVPTKGVRICGHYIPGGISCGISARSTNRDRDVFGPDADKFCPERWIPKGLEDEQRIKRQASLLATFGMGSRGCIGKNLAHVQMYKYLAQFFRHFDAELVDQNTPCTITSQFFTNYHGFDIKIKRR